MSFGISVSIPNYPKLNIVDGWFPVIYLDEIKFTVTYGSPPAITKTYSLPAGTIIYVLPAGEATAVTPSGRNKIYAYSLHTCVTGHSVSISQALWAGYYDSPFRGRVVSFHVYAHFPQTNSANDYGIFLSGNSGVDVALTQNADLDVLLWKRTQYVGGSTSISWDTGIPTSARQPTVYVSDSGRNCIHSYVYSNRGTYWVRILRQLGSTHYYVVSGNYIYRAQPPSGGTIRVAVFGSPPNGYMAKWGMAFYSSKGTRVYSSDHAPLMIRKTLAQPSPYIVFPISSPEYLGDRGGDYLDSQDMTKDPMIPMRQCGISKVRWGAFPVGFHLTSAGRFTAGFLNGHDGIEQSGSQEMMSSETAVNGRVPMIYGSDYFDDY